MERVNKAEVYIQYKKKREGVGSKRIVRKNRLVDEDDDDGRGRIGGGGGHRRNASYGVKD